MKIYSYSLPFKRPLNTGINTLCFREGFLLEEKSIYGKLCFGEVAPFPGFSLESYEDLEAALMNASQLDLNFLAFEGDLNQELQKLDIPLYPSLLLGLESLVEQLKGDRGFFVKSKTKSGILSADLINNPGDLKENCCSVVKMKAGRGSLEEDIELYQRVSENLTVEAIRVDPNRNWNYKDALEFTGKIDLSKLQFIEEPFKDFSLNLKFYRETGVKIGVDESLGTLCTGDTFFDDSIGGVVIKPAVDGGLYRTLEIVDKALSEGVMPIISSVYEGGPAFGVLLKIAQYCPEGIWHGLSTLGYLKYRIWEGDFELKGGELKPLEGRLCSKKYLKRIF